MDKYTKFVLSIIAVGIIGINYHLFKGEIISPAHASGPVHKITICDEYGGNCAKVTSGGSFKTRTTNYNIN